MSEPTGDRPSWRTVGDVVGKVAPALTIVVALSLYFGWARDSAMTDYLGFPESTRSTTNLTYELGSVPALFLPALAAFVALLAWRLVDPALTPWLERSTPAGRWCRRLLLFAWLILPLAALLITGLAGRWVPWQLIVPASLAAGVLLAAYASAVPTRQTARSSSPTTLLVGGLVLLLLFWVVYEYAQVRGEAEAARFVGQFAAKPGIVLFSQEDLRIDAPGVRMTGFTEPGIYRFRYQGLHLFSASGGRLFLLPHGWTERRRHVIVIPDTTLVRVDYLG
ncbi:hypothetical protein [Kitasatospora sp. NPDC097691]|uniref:hypothetical protein n=1 Tax=Kitasatospora sp. NPDC097691 TaxID=3157231 RepID=UPI00332A638B